MTSTRILLVRHGQSEWNASGRWQGWADPPLTSLGRRQANAAAEMVGSVDAVVASDLIRATETAAIISEVIGVGPVLVEERLRERDVGEWTGLTHDEIEETWPGLLSIRPLQPPGGESRDQVMDRVLKGLDTISTAYPGGEVLVIAHGGVIRNLERHLGAEPASLPNLGGVQITIHESRLVLGERLLLLNPDDHITTTPHQL
ncbi:MAG: histidine phosphatase family protein [Acidimicrobiales bacterium]